MAQLQMYTAKLGSPQTTLAATLAADATSMVLTDASVLPAGPNIAVLGVDENCEIVKYTAIDSATNTVSGLVRGQGGSTARVWEAGSIVARNATSLDHDIFKANIEDLETRKSNTGHTHDDRYYTKSEMDTKLDAKTNLSQVASEFSASKAYAIDDLVIYQGALYRFNATHAAGAWNTAHVTACTIVEVMSHFAKFRVSGAVSSGNMTLTDARIDSDHWRVPNGGIYFEKSSNVVSEVNWSTNISQHTITLSATYSAATNVIVELEWMQN